MTREQRWWVAVIHAGKRSALAAGSAAECAGLKGWESEIVHVVVPRGTRVHALPWMRVHISRRFSAADIHPSRSPAQCLASRAVVDAASWKPHPRLACAVLAAAVQQRIVTAPQLREQIIAAGRIRHRRAMLMSLDDIEGGSHAMSEIDLVRLCGKAGLPSPERQAVRVDSSGRSRYLDGRIVRPDGRVILIEVDGAMHLNVVRWWEDQHRSNDLVIEDNAIILRFPAVVLRSNETAVIAQLRRAYFGSS